MTAHQEYKEILATYALSALEAEEAGALEAHLAACAECRAELEQWRDVAAALALSAESAEPSAQLRGRILDGVHGLPRPSSAEAGAREGGTSAGESTDRSNIIQISQTLRPSLSPVLKFAALAASVAFIALATSLVVLWKRDDARRAEIVRLSNRLNQTEEELARARDATELLTAPGARIMELTGTGLAQRSRAKLFYDRDTGRAMLFAYDLPAAPQGKAYQLWFIAGGHPLPGGVFKTDTAGRAVMRDQVPAEGRNATLFAVTLEPEKGVSAPTGEKYLLGQAS